MLTNVYVSSDTYAIAELKHNEKYFLWYGHTTKLDFPQVPFNSQPTTILIKY